MATINKIPNCPPLRFPEFSDEWQETTLGEICSVLGGGTPRTEIQEYWNGDIQWFTPSEIGLNKFVSYSDRTITTEGLNNSGAKLLPIGTILLTTRATIGEMSIATTPCTTNQGFQSLVADSRYTYTEFIYQKIKTLKNELFTKANGSTFKEISATEIRSLTLSLPTLAEQKRIADFLSLIDERIHSLSETIKELKTQKAGLLNLLFSQKLRFPDFTDEWTQTTLSEIAEILNSQRKPITSSDRISGDYPYYGASGIIDYVNAYIFDEELLLVGEDGAKWGKYEKTAFLVNGKYWVNNHAHVLRLPDISAYKFVESYLFFLNLKPFVTGDAPPKLTLESLKSIPIFMPSLEEQKKIADFLSLIDERIEVEEQLLKKYEEQKKYLLRHMFV